MESYQTRLFSVFEQAMPPPQEYDSVRSTPFASLPVARQRWCADDQCCHLPAPQRDIAVDKPNIPGVGPRGSLKDYDGPVAFCIPGNHDWMDGLEAFLRNICCRDWLGGWLLPQVR